MKKKHNKEERNSLLYYASQLKTLCLESIITIILYLYKNIISFGGVAFKKDFHQKHFISILNYFMNYSLLKTCLYCINLLLLISCKHSSRLEIALKSAGDNREELEKVLQHYRNDKQKYLAARFLIENMPGHIGIDSISASKLWPIYRKCVDISEKYQWKRSDEWFKETNTMCKQLLPQYNIPIWIKDVESIKSNWLIREIDRSFQSWKENAYTRNMSFQDFCRYILPYRYAEGVCIDSSRAIFYHRHAGWFTNGNKDFRQLTDSLHEKYSFLKHNKFATSSLPLYRSTDIEFVKRASCDDKAWYNCLQLSALGMASAIDFVPAWGNRSGAHSWNSLIVDGQTWPFEPFWDNERWKYKRIYNNVNIDLAWGMFKLPKVYRHTYECHIDGPIADSKVQRCDIPPLFQNPFLLDVSADYFKAADVEVQLDKDRPNDTRYCYLCVFGSKHWIPVQWGKIDRQSKVVFKDMGCDIIYCPMYYKNGKLKPAGSIFLLNKQGYPQKIICKKETMPISVSTYTYYQFPEEIKAIKRTLVGAKLIASMTPDFKDKDTLACLTDTMDSWRNEVVVSPLRKCRYIRLELPSDSLDLCEMTFFTPYGQSIQIHKQTTNLQPLSSDEMAERMIDGVSATGWRGWAKTKAWICWDLGKEYEIGSIRYAPYYHPYFPKNKNISLYYWDNKSWKISGTKLWEKGVLTFPNVPKGTVYRIKINEADDRIFLYEEGWQQWY